MFALLTKDGVLTWTKEFQKVFECIKQKLVTNPILQGSKWEIPFHIHSGASNRSLGVVFNKQ